ncbi:hypothetical protein O0L34_g3728 [Tuta absoluta]|nr:hypothetical protein O0L34_g3725 [Tuta absoluta]KAJ2938147.1 hypothetical protein O0L34_g3726 [Tuta absoluta]KAJ2938149.1 hypothetical protein O0L34_g3728 [Tuta absoluta]
MMSDVENKNDFKQWIARRYAAFVSSLHQTPEPNINLTYQKGGTFVNETVTTRPTLRRCVLSIMERDYTDLRESAVKIHTKLLVALTNMTTFSLIQRVIKFGGAVVCMNPLPDQLVSYVKEKSDLERRLIEQRKTADEIIYIHLIFPDVQCFTASKYSDLIVAARALEVFYEGRNKTLEKYKAKTDNATIRETTVIEFLKAQRASGSTLATEDQKEALKAIFGETTELLYKEAERVLSILNHQK